LGKLAARFSAANFAFCLLIKPPPPVLDVFFLSLSTLTFSERVVPLCAALATLAGPVLLALLIGFAE
jgi:hypothetical protein